ncbi:MAG: acetyl-CoA carboxylase carboxyltransferase subunit beta [Alphaproteobacteria bacterium]|nr:acetyl-CoA carboxylase carboxyltransferase subunit beta [Alphaproteobacteria bacterium]
MSDGPRWFEQAPPEHRPGPRTAKTEGPKLWLKCPGCRAMVYKEELARCAQVCPRCGHHLRLEAADRIALLVDDGSFERHDADLRPLDPLEFFDSKPYADRIDRTQDKTGEPDAYLAGSATIDGLPVQIGAFDFRFMGGSMGSVVGELITRQIERGVDRRQPVVIVSASGGARMQEGVLSLMQMAKTSAALARLRDEAKQPYISILTHPTTGGVAASFSMLGDLILAEPEALIGFAGPRVIEQTIGEKLPDGFQTSEYLLEHGMIDRIVPRQELREVVSRCLHLLTGH